MKTFVVRPVSSGVGKEIADRGFVEQVLYVELERSNPILARESRCQIDIIPGAESIIFGIVNAGIVF